MFDNLKTIFNFLYLIIKNKCFQITSFNYFILFLFIFLWVILENKLYKYVE